MSLIGDFAGLTVLKSLFFLGQLLAAPSFATMEADGWKGYAWQYRPVSPCTLGNGEYCLIAKGTWDWKRPQFYEFSLRVDGRSNTIFGKITLRNHDPKDIDQVCLVAAFFDHQGSKIGILYANWRSFPTRTYTREAPIKPSLSVRSIALVAVGTKQCDPKAVADAENFYRIRTALGQR
jgi:hypothetical protein